jgi:hypothetical protein
MPKFVDSGNETTGVGNGSQKKVAPIPPPRRPEGQAQQTQQQQQQTAKTVASGTTATTESITAADVSAAVPPPTAKSGTALTVDEGPLVVFGKIPEQKLQKLDSRNPFLQQPLVEPGLGGVGWGSSNLSMEPFSIVVDTNKSLGPAADINNKNPFLQGAIATADTAIASSAGQVAITQNAGAAGVLSVAIAADTVVAPPVKSPSRPLTPFDKDIQMALSPPADGNLVSTATVASTQDPIPTTDQELSSTTSIVSPTPLSSIPAPQPPFTHPIQTHPAADHAFENPMPVGPSQVNIDTSNSPWTFIWPGPSRAAAPDVPHSLALGREGIGRLGLSRLGLSTRPSKALSTFTAFGMGDDAYYFEDDDEDDDEDVGGGLDGMGIGMGMGMAMGVGGGAGGRVPDEESNYETVRVDRRILPDLERGMRAVGGRKSKLVAGAGAAAVGKLKKFVPILGGQAHFAHLTGGAGGFGSFAASAGNALSGVGTASVAVDGGAGLVSPTGGDLHLRKKDAGGISNSELEGFNYSGHLPGGFMTPSPPIGGGERAFGGRGELNSDLRSGSVSSLSDEELPQSHLVSATAQSTAPSSALQSLAKVYHNLFKTSYKPRLAIDPISGLPLHEPDETSAKRTNPNMVTETILPPPEQPSVTVMTASAAKETHHKEKEQDFEKLIQGLGTLSPPRTNSGVNGASKSYVGGVSKTHGLGRGGAGYEEANGGAGAGWRHRFRRRVTDPSAVVADALKDVKASEREAAAHDHHAHRHHHSHHHSHHHHPNKTDKYNSLNRLEENADRKPIGAEKLSAASEPNLIQKSKQHEDAHVHHKDSQEHQHQHNYNGQENSVQYQASLLQKHQPNNAPRISISMEDVAKPTGETIGKSVLHAKSSDSVGDLLKAGQTETQSSLRKSHDASSVQTQQPALYLQQPLIPIPFQPPLPGVNSNPIGSLANANQAQNAVQSSAPSTISTSTQIMSPAHATYLDMPSTPSPTSYNPFSQSQTQTPAPIHLPKSPFHQPTVPNASFNANLNTGANVTNNPYAPYSNITNKQSEIPSANIYQQYPQQQQQQQSNAPVSSYRPSIQTGGLFDIFDESSLSSVPAVSVAGTTPFDDMGGLLLPFHNVQSPPHQSRLNDHHTLSRRTSVVIPSSSSTITEKSKGNV